jgi:hypothetical protein
LAPLPGHGGILMMTLRQIQLSPDSRPRHDSAIPPSVFARLREGTRDKGERRLAAAILEDAVRCFERNRAETGFHRRQLYWETEQWFAGRNPFPIFSFESICLILGLNADGIRAALRDWVVRRADGRMPPFLELSTAAAQTKRRVRSRIEEHAARDNRMKLRGLPVAEGAVGWVSVFRKRGA